MRTRLSYIETELLEKIPFIIQEVDTTYLDHTRIRQRQIDLGNLIKLIYSTRKPMSFTGLYSNSKIRYKHSFLLYLHFAERFNFIAKTKARRGESTTYQITAKGRKFLDFFIPTKNKNW